MNSAKIIITVTSSDDAMELARNIANHINASAHDDWGPDAWGGYDGPVLHEIGIEVVDDEG